MVGMSTEKKTTPHFGVQDFLAPWLRFGDVRQGQAESINLRHLPRLTLRTPPP